MQVHIFTQERYPDHTAYAGPPSPAAFTVEVPEETYQRWEQVRVAYDTMQRELRDLIDPPCPECAHPQSRHQEWSAGWDTWGCLFKVPAPSSVDPHAMRTCRCQHGIPQERVNH